MLKSFAEVTEHIILATGATDFRKQIISLSSMVIMQYNMAPFADGYVFIFCNRKRNAQCGLLQSPEIIDDMLPWSDKLPENYCLTHKHKKNFKT